MRGKYSPAMTREMLKRGPEAYVYNANGEVAPEYDRSQQYDERVHNGSYDINGFDSYGYSAFNEHGEYVGEGNGIDMVGYTEMDYMNMTDQEFENCT